MEHYKFGEIMINIGVVGLGYWGPNLVRNFYSNSETKVVKCCDLKRERIDIIKRTYPTIETSLNYHDLINDPKIDLIVICTPVNTHYEIAKKALKSGKHVLIEKPMTNKSSQAEELLSLAEQKNLKVFVDHTFVFTGAVEKMRQLIKSGEIGDIYYFDSVRVNLGLFQHDINVLWDLAPHDISIMHSLISQKPESVLATGVAHLNNGLENIAYLTVYFPNNILGHIHVNWLSPVKVRETLIAGTNKMIVWDDNQPSEKVRVYDKGIDIINTPDKLYNTLIQYRTGDMYCPKIDTTEALAKEVEHIVDCIINNKNSFSSGIEGLQVVKILEAAEQSIKNRGKEIKI
jgi:predicted dehydrogenase